MSKVCDGAEDIFTEEVSAAEGRKVKHPDRQTKESRSDTLKAPHDWYSASHVWGEVLLCIE